VNQKKGIQAIAAGHICLDITPTFKKIDKDKIKDIFIPGRLINMGKVKVSTGGPVSNVGLALSMLGINAKLMGKVGGDFFGNGVLKLLRKRNADDGMIVVDDEETSYTIVIVPPGIDRIFLHNPGANSTFCADDINYELVKQAKIFHFGYPPLMKKIFENDGEELIKIFKRVKDFEVTTSLDMSLPDAASESGKVEWKKILKNLLPYVDIYLPSVEETMFMIKREEFDRLSKNAHIHDILEKLDINVLPQLGEKLISYGAKIVALKCGVKGYYIRTQGEKVLAGMGRAKPGHLDNWADRELHEESFHVPNIASATGSGDSSIAGFLSAFLNGETIENSIRMACAVGGLNITAFDALSGLKSWDETLKIIKKGWKKNRLTVEGSWWQYDNKRRIWVGNKDKPGLREKTLEGEDL